jgi:hypothetical protein
MFLPLMAIETICASTQMNALKKGENTANTFERLCMRRMFRATDTNQVSKHTNMIENKFLVTCRGRLA